LLSLPSGTRRFSQFSLKCTASPESNTAPVLGSLTSRLWWPGVCPGVAMIVTLWAATGASVNERAA